jgi:hypothetical protein
LPPGAEVEFCELSNYFFPFSCALELRYELKRLKQQQNRNTT